MPNPINERPDAYSGIATKTAALAPAARSSAQPANLLARNQSSRSARVCCVRKPYRRLGGIIFRISGMLAAAKIAHGTRKEIAPSSRRALVPQAHRHLCVSPADSSANKSISPIRPIRPTSTVLIYHNPFRSRPRVAQHVHVLPIPECPVLAGCRLVAKRPKAAIGRRDDGAARNVLLGCGTKL